MLEFYKVPATNDQIFHVFPYLQTWHPILVLNVEPKNQQPFPFYQIFSSFCPETTEICYKYIPSSTALQLTDSFMFAYHLVFLLFPIKFSLLADQEKQKKQHMFDTIIEMVMSQ